MSVSEMNRMRGTVRIIGFSDSDLDSSLQLRLSENLESQFRVREPKTVDLSSELFVKYGGKFDLESTFQVKFNESLESTIIIRPHNKMVGIFEVIEPPTYKKQYPSVKDAFIRSDIPALNYGTEQDMFVGGGYNGETYRSLIQFAPLDLPPEKKVKKAEIVLKVMYSGAALPIGLYEIDYDSKWEEREVTWAIQPSLRGLITTFSSGVYYGNEVRVDVTSIVREWHSGTRPHNGFLLKALNESVSGLYKSYGTKENSALFPVLEVEYYDPTVFSYGRAHLQSSIDIRHYDQLNGELYVRPTQYDEDFGGELYVVDPTSRDGELIVNKPDMPSEIYVPYTNDLPLEVTVRVKRESNLDGTIIVNAPEREGSLYIKFREDLPAEIKVRRSKNEDFSGSLIVNRNEVDGSITVRPFADLEGSIYVIGNVHENFSSTLWVNRPNVDGSITIKPYNDLEGFLTVRRTRDEDLPSELIVNAPDREGSLYVRFYDDLPSEVYVRAVDGIDLDGELFVVSPYLEAEIKVRVQDKDDLPAEVHVRAVTSDDFDSSIIVRVNGKNELPAELSVRVDDLRDLEGSIRPRPHLANDLLSTLDVHYKIDLDAELIVRKSGVDYLPAEVTIKKPSANDLPSGIMVKVANASDLPSEIVIKCSNSDDLSSELIVVYSDDLEGSIEVITDYGYCFIM